MKTTVLKYLLLDADVTIYLHEIDLWKAFAKRFNVFFSGTVANKEVVFYPDSKGNRIPINLKSEKITILEMDAVKAYNGVYSVIDKSTGPGLEMGEIESLALLTEKENSHLSFCSGDKGAIKAACLLGIKDRIISLEEALIKGGMKRNIKRHFTKKHMKEWKKKGEIDFIQGVGLRKRKKI